MRENVSVKNENIYTQSNARFPAPTAPVIIKEKRIKAKKAIGTILGISGRDDVGVEDFIKTLKRAKTRCTQHNLLWDLFIVKVGKL